MYIKNTANSYEKYRYLKNCFKRVVLRTAALVFNDHLGSKNYRPINDNNFKKWFFFLI